jgi:hypothetical protein
LGSVGLDWNYRNVIGRRALQFGSILNSVQDTDGAVQRGRSVSAADLRYLREAVMGNAHRNPAGAEPGQ